MLYTSASERLIVFLAPSMGKSEVKVLHINGLMPENQLENILSQMLWNVPDKTRSGTLPEDNCFPEQIL